MIVNPNGYEGVFSEEVESGGLIAESSGQGGRHLGLVEQEQNFDWRGVKQGIIVRWDVKCQNVSRFYSYFPMVWRGSNSLGGLGDGLYFSFLLISLQNSKNSQTSFATLQIINSSRSWSTSSAVGCSRYSIRRIREKQFYQS